MMKKEITFDRFIRGALVVGGLRLAALLRSVCRGLSAVSDRTFLAV